MKVMDDITSVLKGGAINGPTLYITQKLVSSVDAMGCNYLPPAVPQEVRTPVVGMALAMLPLLVSDHWLAEKVSEYTMANAVAQTLALAGNGGKGGPGPIDAAVNQVFDKIAAVGAPAGGSTQGYVQGRTTQGYMQPRSGHGGGTQGYVQQQMAGGMRSGLRGLTTEHAFN